MSELRSPSHNGRVDHDQFDIDPLALSPMRACLLQASQYGLLNREEEADLAKRIQAGLGAEARIEDGNFTDRLGRVALEEIVRDGQQAKDRLVLSNLRLVADTVNKHGSTNKFGSRSSNNNTVVSKDDIFFAGIAGLVRAVDKFDHTKGYRFTSYAIWEIKNRVEGAEAADYPLSLPPGAVYSARRVKKALSNLNSKPDGPPPADSDVAAKSGVSADKVSSIRRATQPVVPLDRPLVADSQGGSLHDVLASPELPPDSQWAEDEMKQLVTDLLSGDLLEEDEKAVIRHRFGFGDLDPKSWAEVARALGINRTTAQSIGESALRKMLKPALQRGLDYLLQTA